MEEAEDHRLVEVVVAEAASCQASEAVVAAVRYPEAVAAAVECEHRALVVGAVEQCRVQVVAEQASRQAWRPQALIPSSLTAQLWPRLLVSR